MEIIKKKILLEDYISREQVNFGQLTVSAFTLNLFFTQDVDDMGIGTEMYFQASDGSIANYQPLIQKLGQSGYTFEFMNGTTTSVSGNSLTTRYPGKSYEQYFIDGIPISGFTEDRLDNVKSYNVNLPYNPGFDIDSGQYENYQGDIIDGVTRVISNNNLNPIIYTEDADVNDSNLGTSNQESGLLFKTFTGFTRAINTPFGLDFIPVTELYYRGEGINETNSHLSATTKEEYLFGITDTPRVESDLFIDRGKATVRQSHLQLGEISNMLDLTNYGNGYYKIIK